MKRICFLGSIEIGINNESIMTDKHIENVNMKKFTILREFNIFLNNTSKLLMIMKLTE